MSPTGPALLPGPISTGPASRHRGHEVGTGFDDQLHAALADDARTSEPASAHADAAPGRSSRTEHGRRAAGTERPEGGEQSERPDDADAASSEVVSAASAAATAMVVVPPANAPAPLPGSPTADDASCESATEDAAPPVGENGTTDAAAAGAAIATLLAVPRPDLLSPTVGAPAAEVPDPQGLPAAGGAGTGVAATTAAGTGIAPGAAPTVPLASAPTDPAGARAVAPLAATTGTAAAETAAGATDAAAAPVTAATTTDRVVTGPGHDAPRIGAATTSGHLPGSGDADAGTGTGAGAGSAAPAAVALDPGAPLAVSDRAPGLAPGTIIAPTAGPLTGTATAEPGGVSRAVAAQAFPEITRIAGEAAQGPNGTHRITLTLQPAQLGEVRVTLVVRDGSVQVRLAGGAGDGAVQQALASGAADLQRLLERDGTEARVVVRDGASGWTQQGSSGSSGSSAWSGQGGTRQDQDAAAWTGTGQGNGHGNGHGARQRPEAGPQPTGAWLSPGVRDLRSTATDQLRGIDRPGRLDRSL